MASRPWVNSNTALNSRDARDVPITPERQAEIDSAIAQGTANQAAAEEDRIANNPRNSTEAAAGQETTTTSAAPSATQLQMEANVSNPTAQLENQGLVQAPVLIDPNAEGTALEGDFGIAKGTPVQAETAKDTVDPGAALAAVGTVDPAAEAQAAIDTQVSDFDVSTISPNELSKNLAKLKDESPMQAASVTTELNSLLDGLETGDIPSWAKPAVTQVEQQLAARGLSASSIGRDSLFNAIIGAALPIAQQNAAFQQDASKTNYQAKVNAILSDSAAENAALQFNATSVNQKNQFMSNLKATVDTTNAGRKDAIAQFNAAETNKLSQLEFSENTATGRSNAASINQMAAQVLSEQGATSRFNAEQANTIAKFNSEQERAREGFNAQQAMVIAQSNVTWRRNANTANTAVENQINMTNTQNAFNLSNQALSNLWQAERDEAQWAEQASQNDLDRRNRLEANLLANEAAADYQKGALFGNAISGLFDLMDLDV